MAFSSVDFRDGITFTGARTANTVGPFYLLGGRYAVAVSAPSTSATLQALMPDGSTYQAADTAYTGATFKTLDLPPGTFNFIFTATGDVQGFVVRVPYRAA